MENYSNNKKDFYASVQYVSSKNISSTTAFTLNGVGYVIEINGFNYTCTKIEKNRMTGFSGDSRNEFIAKKIGDMMSSVALSAQNTISKDNGNSKE